MCAAYLPPTEDITSFNSSLFTHDSGTGLTQAQADTLYLSKKNTDISTAPLTTFTNQVNLNNKLVLSAGSTPTTQIQQVANDTNIYNTTNGGIIKFNSKTSGAVDVVSLEVQPSQIITRVNSLLMYNGTNSQNNQIESATDLKFQNNINSGRIVFYPKSSGGANTESFGVGNSTISINTETLSFGFNGTLKIVGANVTTLEFFIAFTNQTINFLTGLTTGIVNWGAVASTSLLNLNSRLLHRQTQYINQIQTISITNPSALTFPLEETIMLSSTGSTNINITLPLINSSNYNGFNFIFTKTGSITNSVIFTASGTNNIYPISSITNASPLTTLANTNTSCSFTIVEISAGNFIWRQIS